MENKFCLKTKEQLDEIRKTKAQKMNENSQRFQGVGFVGYVKPDGSYFGSYKTPNTNRTTGEFSGNIKDAYNPAKDDPGKKKIQDAARKALEKSESRINEISDKVVGKALSKRFAQARKANKEFYTKYPKNPVAIDKDDPRAKEWLADSDKSMDLTMKARKMYNRVMDRNRARREAEKVTSEALSTTKKPSKKLNEISDKIVSDTAAHRASNYVRTKMRSKQNNSSNVEKMRKKLAKNMDLVNKRKARVNKLGEALTARQALAKSKAILEDLDNFSEEPTFWGYATDMPEVELPKSAVLQICHSGDNADDVDEVKEIPMVKAQIDKWTDEEIDGVRHQLDMTDEEFDNLTKDEKISYIIWIAAWNIFEDEEYYDELHEKLKKSIKEEYGEHAGEPAFEEIAGELESGNTYGYGNYYEWGEVTVNGQVITDLLKTDEILDWTLREISFPVRDGHDYYRGLNLIFNNYSYTDAIDLSDDAIKDDLVSLGFGEGYLADLQNVDSSDDPNFKEIETWIDYDIHYEEYEEDDLEENKKSSRRIGRKINEVKTKTPPKIDTIQDLIHQITQNKRGESAAIHYDWDKKQYEIEDNETGDVLVSGKAKDIIAWAKEKGAKEKGKKAGFSIDGAETLDQVYQRNWDRAMSRMNAKSESLKINEESYTKEEAVDVNGRPLKAGVVYKINNAAAMKFTGEFNELNMPLFQPIKGKTYTQEMSPYNSFEPITNKSESLTEDDNKIKFHDELNPKLWENFELKSDVKNKLNEIAEAFKEYLDIPEEAIQDIRITGSSASYNYTKYSDLDLHLIVDYEKIHEDCPLVEGYLWSYKSAFNRDHDISIYGVPVEVYAEDSKSEAVSNGVYSLKEDKWLKKPEKIEPLDNGADVQAKFQELREAVEKCDDSEVAEQLLDKIYKMRKSGLEEVGEFSTENMAFKLLRNEGYMDKLKNLKKEQVDKKLSLESLKRKPTRLTKMTEKADYVYELVHKKTGRTIWSHTRRMPGYTFTGKKLENKPEYSDTTKKYWNESKINEISDEVVDRANQKRHSNLEKSRVDFMKKAFDFDDPERQKLQDRASRNTRKAERANKLYNDRRFRKEFDGDVNKFIDYIQDDEKFKKIKNRMKIEDETGRPAYNIKLGKNESKINEANEDAKIKIFLTNLGKYNEGDLVGEWVELPVDDFQPILDRIGINDEYEEWFITDYEAPFEIGEYDDIYELNEVAEAIENFSDTELEVLEAFKDNGYDMKEAIEKVADNEYTYIEGNTEEDLAYGWIDMIGSFDDAVSDNDKNSYFDYEAFGRDLVLGGDYTRVDDAVDLSQFPDRDTAEMVFGSYGEDKPTEEELAEFKELLDLADQALNLSDDELAEFEEQNGIVYYTDHIIKDGVDYDIETMQMIVDEDYAIESGYKDYEGSIIDVADEKALAEYVVDDVYGGPQELSQDELERYFDYGWFGKTLSYDFYKTDNGWVDIN